VKCCRFARTSLSETAPGMTAAMAGCASGNWSATAARETRCASAIARMRPTRACTPAGGSAYPYAPAPGAEASTPGGEDRPDDHAHAALEAERELVVERVLIEERVRHQGRPPAQEGFA
jgi:hypothetical protein